MVEHAGAPPILDEEDRFKVFAERLLALPERVLEDRLAQDRRRQKTLQAKAKEQRRSARLGGRVTA